MPGSGVPDTYHKLLLLSFRGTLLFDPHLGINVPWPTMSDVIVTAIALTITIGAFLNNMT